MYVESTFVWVVCARRNEIEGNQRDVVSREFSFPFPSIPFCSLPFPFLPSPSLPFFLFFPFLPFLSFFMSVCLSVSLFPSSLLFLSFSEAKVSEEVGKAGMEAQIERLVMDPRRAI